jgi:hypothetical protein
MNNADFSNVLEDYSKNHKIVRINLGVKVIEGVILETDKDSKTFKIKLAGSKETKDYKISSVYAIGEI